MAISRPPTYQTAGYREAPFHVQGEAVGEELAGGIPDHHAVNAGIGQLRAAEDKPGVGLTSQSGAIPPPLVIQRPLS